MSLPIKHLAGCVIFDWNMNVLLLHRNTPELTQWELPGGKVEVGETHEEAAIRELKEELGIEVRLTAKLGNTEFDDNGIHWIYTWFQARIEDGIPQIMETERYDDLEFRQIMGKSARKEQWSVNIVRLSEDLNKSMPANR